MKKTVLFLVLLLFLMGCEQGSNTEKFAQAIEEASQVAPQLEEPVVVTEKMETEMTEPEKTEAETEKTEHTETVEGTQESITIDMVAVGDIMFHNVQVSYAQTADGYDFTGSFEMVRPMIENADIAVGNFETTSNPEYEYSGYPQFNTPAEAIDAIQGAGFDVLSTINNHTLDTYIEGVDSTIDAIRSRGLDNFGTRKDADEPILIKEVNGISIAFLGYTYAFNGLEYTVTDEEFFAKLSPLREEIIEREIKEARELADVIVVYPHWGVEYSRWPSEEQQYLAHKMVEWGAHLVLGSHPHVVQPQEWTTHPDGNEAYIIYSMGNFLSSQRLEYNEDIHVEQSVLLNMQITKDEEGIHIDQVNPIPLWVDETDERLFVTLPAQQTLDEGALDGWRLDRIQQAIDDTNSILSESVGE